ncbi:MAG: DUF262 domain-containing protein, partial [Corynebacterium sp.]|nr:DUF262 domain-containing protein [Corynebacterium sp.]
MGFTTPSYGLDDLFARIVRGDIQLPDFQRNYVWDEDHIRSLLVTVLRGYPIGALMALDTRNEPMRFRPRPLAGAPDTGRSPGLLILDGQQRLTSLYHAFSPDGWVETLNFRGEAVRRAFFIDVAAAVSEDIVPDEAIFAVDEQGQVTSHFGPDIVGNLLDEDVHIGHQCLPIAGMLSDDGTRKLFQLSAAEVRDGEDISSIVADFHSRVFFPLAGYDVPMIRLARETARAGIGPIFAQANAAGVHMDVFDLLTAVFSLEDENFHLAHDWARVEKQLRKYPALDGIGRTQFLSAVSLYSTVNKGHAGGQREDILTLTLSEYQASVEKPRITFQEVAEFLKQRCIYTVEQVPYSAQ